MSELPGVIVPRGDDMVRLPAAVVESYDWQKDAACLGMDPDMFFHPWGDTPSNRLEREKLAVAVCNGCVVIERCRQWALEVREPYGVWGGLTEDERRTILGRRRLR